MTLVGELLENELEKNGIGEVVDQTNMAQELNKKGWGTEKGYSMSRKIVESFTCSLAIN